MPEAVEQEEIILTEAELAARAERLGVEFPQSAEPMNVDRVLRYINESDNDSELKRISRLSRKKLRDMGVIPRRKPEKKPSKFRRFISRLATESAPIVFTLFVTTPLVVWISYLVLQDLGFFRMCPGIKCNVEDLIFLMVTSVLSALFIYLSYGLLRKFFLKLRP